MFLESSLWGLFLTIAHFTSLNLKIGDTSATRDERDMVTWVSIGWALQKTEILSSKSPASSPWQSCFQSRSFASWADRGKQRLEIAPTVLVRLSTRDQFRQILLVLFILFNVVTTWAMDEEQCFRRHLQRAAQCSVASSNNRFGYLCILSWAFSNGTQLHY